MDSLAELIKLLDNSDKKLFKEFLRQKNKRNDVKNLRLFSLIETDDISKTEGLYKTAKNKDAYHALRKRLQDSLLIFISQRTLVNTNSETYEALRWLVAGRFLLEKGVEKVGFKCLDKAGRMAENLEQFNLLNELLLLKLQYAHLPGAQPLDGLTARFMQNQANMQREAKLNMAYAYLRQELQQIHLKGKVVNLTALLIATIRKYKILVQDLMTYKAVYQILFIANEYADIQQNYTLIERYVARTRSFIDSGERSKQPYGYYYLSVLYLLANFHLRQKHFAQSSNYLSQMAGAMAADNRYNHQFELRYGLLKSLNLYFTGQADDAILLLQQLLGKAGARAKTEDVEDLRVCLVMFLGLCHHRDSLKQLSLLTRSDAWYEKKMGMLWTIRKNLMEILIQAQFGNIELAMSRISSFRRRYKKYLLSTAEERVLVYLRLVEKHLQKPDVVFNKAYQKEVAALLAQPQGHDIFTLGFIAWLMARWQKLTPYKIVLTFMP